MPDSSLVSLDGVVVEFKSSGGVRVPKSNKGAVVRAVDGVSLQLSRGSTLGLVGESGSGKTTVGRTTLGLVPIASGSVTFEGSNLYSLKRRQLQRIRRKMQMVYQSPFSSLDPHMTIRQIVAEPLLLSGMSRREVKVRAKECLDLVGLANIAEEKRPNQFSGGQRQRIAIARAIATHPDFIVCDEPTSALDVSVQAQVINLLKQLQTEMGITYLFISHDLAVMANMADRIAVMYRGKIVEQTSTAALSAGMTHPYSVALLSSVTGHYQENVYVRTVLAGEAESNSVPTTGCGFRDRCWLYRTLGRPERCETVEPSLYEEVPGTTVACHYSSKVSEYVNR